VTFPNPQPVEWNVTIDCDGVPVNYLVRRRNGLADSDGNVNPIDCFQFWRNETLVGDVVLPAMREPRRHEEAILQSLHKILGCSVATVVSDKDAITAVFGDG
jgi:hypothetical protein